ncbi:NAD(P)/FAD-dependent oxidoreductase [Occallatibacter savannae]|uniref:NAD(P)/FAD-dependent oxidoreductase n=1 Tax=Occallatibacter savannae TaxID=1002691 RepID=UPI000D69BB9D|nr:FAD-dependent monooxygenase [Occallatibacter savannae]
MSGAVDHVVIGGGLAGSMAALRLAAAGREVLLLEKQRGPHDKVCGEFLSAEALGYLERAGVDARALGAHAIERVRVHSGSGSVQVKLPFAAMSLSRRVLDEALLAKAAAAGCEVRRGAFVERVAARHDGFSVRVLYGEAMDARHVFLATGKHDVAEHARGAGTHRDLVGFKMHWRLTQRSTDAIRRAMELFLFRDGYGGIALVEDDRANLCFVVRRRRVAELGGWAEMVRAICEECPGVAETLREGAQCWPKPLAISPIPYGYIAKQADGIWRIGDQAAVIPSFTGDGMSIALHSGELAAEMFLRGRAPEEYLARLRNDLQRGMRLATLLSRAMVTRSGRAHAPAVLTRAPGMIGWIAERTRIPKSALPKMEAGIERSVSMA